MEDLSYIQCFSIGVTKMSLSNQDCREMEEGVVTASNPDNASEKLPEQSPVSPTLTTRSSIFGRSGSLRRFLPGHHGLLPSNFTVNLLNP